MLRSVSSSPATLQLFLPRSIPSTTIIAAVFPIYFNRVAASNLPPATATSRFAWATAIAILIVAIAVAGLQPDDIDVILVATLTPDYWMPSTGALVKEAIGNTTAVQGLTNTVASPTRNTLRADQRMRAAIISAPPAG